MRTTGIDTHKLALAAKDQAESFASEAKATGLIAQNAEKSLKATQDSFRLDQRAWIGEERTDVGQYDADKLLRADLVFLNTGKTPAKNVRHGETMTVTPAFAPGPSEKDFAGVTLIQGATIAPQARMTLGIGLTPVQLEAGAVAILKLGSAQYALVRSRQMFVYVFGRVVYEDVYGGKIHTTQFCHYLSDTALAKDPPRWQLANCDTLKGMD
jgi:hypothetical protein